jgi:hypothetical protein
LNNKITNIAKANSKLDIMNSKTIASGNKAIIFTFPPEKEITAINAIVRINVSHRANRYYFNNNDLVLMIR